MEHKRQTLMRFILIAAVLIAGVSIGMNAIDRVEEMTEQRQSRLCKIDPSLCQ